MCRARPQQVGSLQSPGARLCVPGHTGHVWHSVLGSLGIPTWKSEEMDRERGAAQQGSGRGR